MKKSGTKPKNTKALKAKARTGWLIATLHTEGLLVKDDVMQPHLYSWTLPQLLSTPKLHLRQSPCDTAASALRWGPFSGYMVPREHLCLTCLRWASENLATLKLQEALK